jgi:hypothetical protein
MDIRKLNSNLNAEVLSHGTSAIRDKRVAVDRNSSTSPLNPDQMVQKRTGITQSYSAMAQEICWRPGVSPTKIIAAVRNFSEIV